MSEFGISKIGAGRYIQGYGAISCIGREAKNFGRKSFIIGGEKAVEASLPSIEDSLNQSGINFNLKINKGFCSYENLELFSNNAASSKADMIIGVGGGKCMDLTKAVAMKLNLPVITIPTIAATCAAWTPFSVMYAQNGSPLGSLHHEREISCCIADTNIIANAPARTLASGIADSFAKSEEIANGVPELTLGNSDVSVYTSYRLAKVIDEILYARGEEAYHDCIHKSPSSALSDIVYTNIAITGACSGFASGSRQLSMAHTFNNALRTGFTEEMNEYYHGELVGLGIIVQMSYNKSSCKNSYKKICKNLGLPVSLRQLDITPTEKVFDYVLRFIISKMQMEEQYGGIDGVKQGLVEVFQ